MAEIDAEIAKNLATIPASNVTIASRDSEIDAAHFLIDAGRKEITAYSKILKEAQGKNDTDTINKMNDNKLMLSILGDGPEKPKLQKINQSNNSICFLGKVSHQTINKYLEEADLFLFCSIKEGGSHSLFEASMNNIPIACYDISGMEVFPKNDSSIKIKPQYDIEKNTTELANLINEKFLKNQTNELCSNAIDDLKENYDWQSISKRIETIYKGIK
jgi:glycosyltransferase involved in cell wall biosynthesis